MFCIIQCCALWLVVLNINSGDLLVILVIIGKVVILSSYVELKQNTLFMHVCEIPCSINVKL